MTLIEHKGLGLSIELKDLTQRDLERFYVKRREDGLDPDVLTQCEYTGAIVRIASELDLFSERLDIDNWKSAGIVYLYTEFIKLVVEAQTIPKE